MNLARILAIALATVALAAPTALARPIGIDEPVSTPTPAAGTDDARPDTAGNASVAGDTEPASTAAADSGDGIAPLPFVVTVAGALLVGLGVGGGLHRMHVRRHAIGQTA